jgi:hypothetical protein
MMIGSAPISTGLQVVLDGDKGSSLQGDSSDRLIPVGLEVLDLEATHFGLL